MVYHSSSCQMDCIQQSHFYRFGLHWIESIVVVIVVWFDFYIYFMIHTYMVRCKLLCWNFSKRWTCSVRSFTLRHIYSFVLMRTNVVLESTKQNHICEMKSHFNKCSEFSLHTVQISNILNDSKGTDIKLFHSEWNVDGKYRMHTLFVIESIEIHFVYTLTHLTCATIWIERKNVSKLDNCAI